jgi:ParB-like chromosome segregation protein Spo0J
MTNVDKYQVLPDLPPEQFAALKQDIAQRGVVVPVIVDEFGAILEGHHRVRACRELGRNDYPVEVRAGMSETEKRIFARKMNVLRRQLTREQTRGLIEDQLRDTPDWSDRRIGKELGVDHKTVGAARSGLAATGEFPQLEKTVGRDGKARSVRKAPRRQNPTLDADDYDDVLDADEEGGYGAQVVGAGVPPETKAEARARRREEGDRKRDEKEWEGWGATPEQRAKMMHALDLITMGADPNGEKVTKLLREASVCTIETAGYNPLAGRSEEEGREWHLFMLLLARDGGEPQNVSAHVEWILQRPFQNVAEWLGEEGEKFRRRNGIRPVPDAFRQRWRDFLAEQQERTLDDIIAELIELERHRQAQGAGRSVKAKDYASRVEGK